MCGICSSSSRCVRISVYYYPANLGYSLITDILFEHVAASGAQGDRGGIRERRGYPVDEYDVLELPGGAPA